MEHVHVHTHLQTHLHTLTHVLTHTHTRTHAHTRTHKHTHTHTLLSTESKKPFKSNLKYAAIPTALIGIIRIVDFSFKAVDPELDVLFVLPLAIDLRHGHRSQVVALRQNPLRRKCGGVLVNQLGAPLVDFRHLQMEGDESGCRVDIVSLH